MTTLLKDQQRRDMEMFAIGYMVAANGGTPAKCSEDDLTSFRLCDDLAKRFVKWDEDENTAKSYFASFAKVSFDGSKETLFEEIMHALAIDSMLVRIANMANHVQQHGKGNIDTDQLKAIHELTGQYLEQIEG